MDKEARNKKIVELYESGEKTTVIAERFGLSVRGITLILNKCGAKMRPTGYKKYSMNEDFFKTWSNEMAWVLGFIVTDGCINQNQSLTIGQKDPYPLQKIKELLQFNGKVVKYDNKNIYELNICSKEIITDLFNLGVTRRKSLTIVFPECPKEYLSHFVRGVIDGDGYVHPDGYTVTVTSGSLAFAQGLLSVFKKWNLRSKINTVFCKSSNPIYRINVTGKESVKRLSDIVYKDSREYCVLIKKEKMMQILSKDNLAPLKRVNFRTNISKSILEKLQFKAKEHNTYINYLLETGIRKVISDNETNLVKKNQTDRIQFKTTYDRELLDHAKAFAKSHGIYLNDLIEYAANQIDIVQSSK
ncbi:LAGLIDADG family homing endonuclease [Bacillus sp. FJAT-18017]|uniref:LAGLIDADG family homing endonuclease n=1 Tax=Bacillus sp. FJAT-18017 TaxID=1705566 RepID=UPI0006AF0634|nr:LAGLIDADG family homing endonuclease [Bacillus sp. FJAT-18017]